MKTQISNDAKEVLDYFGLEEKDFERLERFVDFDALARSIRDPTKVAVCNILNGEGKVVVNSEGPVKVHREVAIANAKEEMKKKSLVFVEWW